MGRPLGRGVVGAEVASLGCMPSKIGH